MELLNWAANSGAFIIEDDYDSEYRFEGRPIPALMSMDRGSSVILVGSFSKLLFPSLRIGYIVAPPALASFVVAFRVRTDFRSVHVEQAVLCDFIERGHLGQHLRRTREVYAGRLATLLDAGKRYLRGAVTMRPIQSGYTQRRSLKTACLRTTPNAGPPLREWRRCPSTVIRSKQQIPKGCCLVLQA